MILQLQPAAMLRHCAQISGAARRGPCLSLQLLAHSHQKAPECEHIIVKKCDQKVVSTGSVLCFARCLMHGHAMYRSCTERMAHASCTHWTPCLCLFWLPETQAHVLLLLKAGMQIQVWATNARPGNRTTINAPPKQLWRLSGALSCTLLFDHCCHQGG